MDDNPFDSEEFVCDIQLWIQRLNPDQLRELVQRRGLIKARHLIDDLQLIQAQQGVAAHNAKLISILDPGEMDTYQGLCNVIQEMGYTDRYHQMIQLLPQDRVQRALSSCVAAKQPESAYAIAAREYPPVTMATEECMTAAAAASAGYAAYQSTPGSSSPSPLGQQVAPLCPPMKSRTAAARPGADGGEAPGATAVAGAAAAAAEAAAGAAAGIAETDAAASSATVLTPEASLQARLPIGTVMSERASGARAETELGATATVSAVPALHHCHHPGAQPPLALQPGAALACSSTGRLPSSMSGPSTTAETTIGLSQTCMSASTQATTTHPIASSANTSTGSFTADGNAAGRGTALQQSTPPPASVLLENTAQLAAAAVVRHASSLPLEPQAKRALLRNVGRAFTEEMSRHIDYVSVPSMAHTSPDSQASLLQKSQFLLDSTEMSEGDTGLSGSAASSDTEKWTKNDLRNARVTVFVDSKLRTSVDDCDGIILDSLSQHHFSEMGIIIKSKTRRGCPEAALIRVAEKAGRKIRTLITIIIKGRYDDSTEHKIERELLEDLEALTYSRHQIQVLFRGPYDSIQVVLLLPMRTLGHLLYLAVHYPGLLRGLDILQIIDISSLTIIDFREITGNSSSSTVALDELTEDDGELSEDNEDDEDEDDVEVLPQSYDNELEFSRRTDIAAAAEDHISQQEYDKLNNRSKDFQLVLAVIMRSHRKDHNFLTAIRTCISNEMPSSTTARPWALPRRRKRKLLLTSPERIEMQTAALKQTTLKQHPVREREQIRLEKMPISPVEMPISPRKIHRPPTQIPWRTSRTPDTLSEMSQNLLSASLQGDLQKIAALVKSGADVNYCDQFGDTPLHDAASSGNLEVCQALIAGGADSKIKNESGDTPLHNAATRGELKVCQALLAAGADCNIKNEIGKTPLDTARNVWKRHAVVELLEKATPKTS